MATIKEIAKYAGVSTSTVSIVLGGKSEERKIPLSTQKKVIDAANEHGYRANVAARRLRARPDSPIVIEVFWATDFRAPMMVRFLRGLQKAILDTAQLCEIVIHPYDNDKLCDALQAPGICNAAIICNASQADMAFLEKTTFNMPVVLYNRHSTKYCTVNVDDANMGSTAARIFASHGCKHAAVLTSPTVFSGMDVRISSFSAEAQSSGMTVLTLTNSNSMRGGYDAGILFTSISPKPDCLFCLSDYLAVGVMRAFQETGISIPDEIEMISIGNGDRELEEFSRVKLSVIHLPMEEMAASCFQLAIDLLDNRIKPPYSIKLPTPYIVRESCGDMA